MNKIFCFINREFGSGDLGVVALADNGMCVGGHVSSSLSFAKHDIGINSTWHHEDYKKEFPDGYELIWKDNPNDLEILQAVQKNKTLPTNKEEN
jgi:hypothetical protein